MQNKEEQEGIEAQFFLTVKYDRSTVTYKPYEQVTGNIIINHKESDNFAPFVSNELKIKIEGVLTAQNKNTNKQLDAVTKDIQPSILIKEEVVVAQSEKITPQNNTFPFKFKLIPRDGEKFVETYIGVYISISYEISARLKFQTSGKKIAIQSPFYIQVPGQGKENIKGEATMPRPVQIEMSPQKLIVQNQQQKIPEFNIKGKLISDIVYFSDDINGSFIIEECDGKVRTIDLQLIRVEKIENEAGKFQEATEIQLIQVAMGNVSRKLEIPLYMIYPIYFSCPNFTNKEYKVDFEVNFIMILFDGFKITMNFPLNIIR